MRVLSYPQLTGTTLRWIYRQIELTVGQDPAFNIAAIAMSACDRHAEIVSDHAHKRVSIRRPSANHSLRYLILLHGGFVK